MSNTIDYSKIDVSVLFNKIKEKMGSDNQNEISILENPFLVVIPINVTYAKKHCLIKQSQFAKHVKNLIVVMILVIINAICVLMEYVDHVTIKINVIYVRNLYVMLIGKVFIQSHTSEWKLVKRKGSAIWKGVLPRGLSA